MRTNIVVGVVIATAVVALVVMGIVFFTNRGGNLASAINCTACTADGKGSVSCASKGASSGCVQGQVSSASEQLDMVQLEKDAVAYYGKNFGDFAITAKPYNAGCCTGFAIVKDGKVIDNLKYKDGQFWK